MPRGRSRSLAGCARRLRLACALSLLSNVQIWCHGGLEGRAKFVPRIVALSFSLMLAFSQSMWSQAVIAEVYALHALLVAVFLMLCYSWVQHPASDRLMFAVFFTLALSLSNHHLTIVLAGLPYLLILLLRRRAFLDWLFAGLITLLLGYLGFAILSQDSGRPENGNSVLLLCRRCIRSFCVAKKRAPPLEADCLPANPRCGRALTLRLHAARFLHQSSDELGVYAGRRRILLLNQSLAVSRKSIGTNSQVTWTRDGDIGTQVSSRRGRNPRAAQQLSKCSTLDWLLLAPTDQGLFDRRANRILSPRFCSSSGFPLPQTSRGFTSCMWPSCSRRFFSR